VAYGVCKKHLAQLLINHNLQKNRAYTLQKIYPYVFLFNAQLDKIRVKILVLLKDSKGIMGTIKLKIFFIGFLYLGFNTPSQDSSSVQQLIDQIPQVKGKDVTDLLNKISEQYRDINSQKAVFYAEKAKKQAEKIQDFEGLAQAFINRGIIARNLKQNNKALKDFDEARRIANSQNLRLIEADALHKMGIAYLLIEKYDSALFYSQAEIALWQKTDDSKRVAKALNLKAFALLHQNKYKQAESALDSALKYQNQLAVTEEGLLNTLLTRKAFQLEKNRKSLEHEKSEGELHQRLLLFLVVSVVLSTFLVWLIISRNKSSRKLIVKKNKEIINQANEIEEKRLQLEQQAKTLQEQAGMLASKSQKIEESLDYAKQVQDSLLPPNPSFLNIFDSYFVLNIPQDVISGDFCWYTHQGDSINVVVADCSGHGVSGAFNTVIINSLVAQIINETSYRTPADLLSELHKRILKLIPVDQYINFNIGIKIGILKINVNNFRMVYAGAKIPLYYMTDGELKMITPDKVFVGGSHYLDISNRFNNKMISLKKGDKLMIFTDGYQDQFGSKNRGKFMVKNLRRYLSDIAEKPLLEQQKSLIEKYKSWKEEEQQTDDILAFGIQI